MATMAELARKYTRLGEEDLAHLHRLVADWGMLSDFCFADLLLFVPVEGSEGHRFVVLGQIRPTTNQTLYREDLVGRVIDEVERPFVARAWSLGEIVEGELHRHLPGRAGAPAMHPGAPPRPAPGGHGPRVGTDGGPASRRARAGLRGDLRPVRPHDRVGGVPVRGPRTLRPRTRPASATGWSCSTGAAGWSTTRPTPSPPCTAWACTPTPTGCASTSWASPPMPSTGPTPAARRSPRRSRRPDVIVALRCLPLLEAGKVTGAVVLLRDVSDLRRRDRLLVTMDATIREVHHRVKNNLQTISSLLRLQARREPPGGGRAALEEAERRIRSIALIHEILSREPAIRSISTRSWCSWCAWPRRGCSPAWWRSGSG